MHICHNECYNMIHIIMIKALKAKLCRLLASGPRGRVHELGREPISDLGFQIVDKFFRLFREITQGWVVGWFEPELPHAETLNI